jgi:hypothetical protein
MRRLTIALLTAAPLAVLLAGCSSGGGGSTAAPTPSAPPATTAAPEATASAGDAPTTAPATADGGGTAASSRCHTSDLKVTVAADEGGGAAGTSYEALVFTNASKRTCTLYGYPGVSYVAGDQGTQINDPFQRQTATKKPTVSLKPGAAAHASIGIPNYQNYPAATCKPTAVRGFRVYPPDETAAVFVSQSMKACSVKGNGIGLVLPIESGGGAGPIK